ncbi:hypothetical protein PCASD_00153 [Puccinia coronata f. sp. avenae]|uniref:Uncharacterized protein n=1 Tax=Puccinia coronata f. sp. avenae TaxID=200324 RepID=A0A2N5VQS3_9BASI|nr:hypothetical protein PCASD_00153 [Puccinia coronata f. sp. avenae]
MKPFMLAVWAGLIASSWSDPEDADEGGQLSFLPMDSDEETFVAPARAEHPNLVFSSFAGLLQQWPNTYAYSGHSIVPGIIPRGTLLYHGTNHRTSPPSQGFEWLSFNPEYSYVVHTLRLGQLHLHKYTSTRALRIIYLDGQGASVGSPGFMDTQSVLIDGTVPKHFGNEGRYIEADYVRAGELCKIGSEWGFEGIVRMNSCFELVWCDFSQGLELLGSTNTTDPFDTHYEPGEFPESMKVTEAHTIDSLSNSSMLFLQNRSDAINPLFPDEINNNFRQRIEVFGANDSAVKVDSQGGSSHDPTESLLQFLDRPQVINSPFFLRSGQYYFRASHRQFFMPGEVRVTLDPSGFVSFYDRIGSLSQKRQVDGTEHGPRHAHTLYGISSSDVKKIKDRLIKVLTRKNAEGWRTDSDRLDWRALVWTIIQTYSKPLSELDYILKRDDLSAFKKAGEVRDLTYNMLLPHLDFSSWSISDPAWIDNSIRKCATGFTAGTYHASELTESIELIIAAIEGTLDRLCSTVLSIFSQAIELSSPNDLSITPDNSLESAVESQIPKWRQKTEELMAWLGWSTWAHCDPPCKPNEMCLPPVWPIFWMKGRPDLDNYLPVCSDAADLKGGRT